MSLSRFFLPLTVALFLGGTTTQGNLIGYWAFENSAQIGQDSSGNSFHLNPVGTALHTASGRNGGGLSVNGAGAYLTGAVSGLPVGNSPYTIAAWIRPSVAGDRGIVGWGNFGTARQVNALRLMGANGFRHYWWAADLDASDAQVTAKGVTLTSGWNHIVAVYNGSLRALYLNGQLLVSDTPGANGATNNNFRIGSTNNGEFFNGILDDVAIWNHAITTQEITALAAGGSPLNGPQITSFTADKTTAFENEAVQLSWTINTSQMTGTLNVTIARGATQLFTGTAATGNFSTTIPDLAASAQQITYTLTATEVGGNNVSRSATVNVAADPGIPAATPQSGLTTTATNPLQITLAGNDPNGGTLTFSIVSPASHGLITGSGANRIYTAGSGYYGPDNFTFKVSDGKYESAPATIALTVLAPPTAPAGISLSSTRIPDPTASGAFIANISTSDVNINEAHTYTLVGGAGSSDNARFSISGHQLRAAQAFTGVAGSSYSIRLRSTDAQGLFVEQAFTLAAVARTAGVVINEVHYNGINNTIRNEFIELYNSGAATVNLTGWRLSGAIEYSFPANTSLAAGEYLLVAEDPATILARFSRNALGPWTGQLSSRGETIRLRDAADLVISEVDYRVGFPWPVASDGDGASIELINPALDQSLGSHWRAAAIPSPTATIDTATPGAVNLQFSANAAPAIRGVLHTPNEPSSIDPIVITARVTDPDGVASVQLLYQLCAPGNFIPSTLPKAISGGQFVNVSAPLAPNPAFEDPANWITVAMNDDGLGSDVQDGDGIWTATIPPQPHRTLVRYRMIVADNSGATARVPYPDDKSLNFACFVYNGVPDYQGTSGAALTSLPTYHFLTRQADYFQAVAYNPAFRLTPNTASWTFENWQAAFVYDGVVYDHIRYRLHGANGRYSASGVAGAAATSKRAFKFLFNKGYLFEGKDNYGAPYPTPWSTMITEGCWENRATHTFSLNEIVNFHLWNVLGVPAPLGNFAHFRTIMQPAEQPDPWHGDFWGLMYVHEDHDKQFLDAHGLADGNLYKLTKDNISGISQQRYQAPFAPTNGSDHDELHNQLRGTSTPAFITSRVNFDLWARSHAFAEAIRHYDYWPSGDNNAAWYFEPNYSAANNFKGLLWVLPNDVDATWGPTWNNGHDLVHNSIFNDAASPGGDTFTNPSLWPRYFNQVREVRDLLFQPDQINPLIDEYAAILRPFVNADFARWFGAPSDAGNFNGLAGPGMSSPVGQTSLAAYVADMKDFAFDPNNNGGTWPGAGNIGVGGRAAHMDRLQAMNGEGPQLPATPTLAYAGAPAHPVNDLRFSTSPFGDPQGANTFGAIQWRVAEVTDPTAPAYVPGERLKLEWSASFVSAELATFAGEFRFPAAACVAGHTYRARVRHKDNTGRWSHWSAPVQFTASAADATTLINSLVISELMYHPLPPSTQEGQLGFAEDDFEYVELRNVSANTVDLTDVRFANGIHFDFPSGTALAAGANLLVVRNVAAFNARYGSGKPIAGAWETGDQLSNGGEEVTLMYGANVPIRQFTYDDVPPWPVEADTLGCSIVLIAPETRPNHALGANWRASRVAGGTPGGDDRTTFASWAAAHGVSSPAADDDGDGLSNWLEYALGGDPRANDATILPQARIESLTVAGVTADYLTITFTREIAAEDAVYHVESSSDLAAWNETPVRVRSLFNGDGTVTETWRAATPVSAEPKLFLRLRVTGP